jgi:heterodisulfide reductase subunit A
VYCSWLFAHGKLEGGNLEKGVLVIGGGIAGMQAALDLANAGIQVYLVERTPSIGGRMAQLDKCFPSMDCAI